MTNLMDLKEVQIAIQMRREATILEGKAKDLKQKADEKLMPILISHNQKTINDPESGTYTYIPPGPGTRALNKDKLRSALVNRGVAPYVINDSIDEATTIGKPKKDFIMFRASKKVE